ncbi:multidrug and toxin extrusion protein 2-like [Antedon mediterranea]|uniref:multidrug and toxin extrusion protein 2-like n=1 Tax=Antedon mediterranea TaxID=105859 RepID=UPI003AF74E33
MARQLYGPRFEPLTFSLFKDGVKDILRKGSVLALSFILEYLMLSVCVFFCSRLGKNEMAAITLAQAFICGICVVPAVGLMTVCNTYFSVGHGANLGRSQGIYLQKMVYLSIIASLLFCAILINIEEILLVLIDEPEIMGQAQLIAFGLSRILQCRDRIYITAIAAAVTIAIDVLLNYILVYVLCMGFRGSAIAVVVAQYINCIILIIYVYMYEDLELGLAVVIGVALFLLRDYAGYVYTNDREIITAFSKIIFLAMTYVISVTIQGIVKAILQAIGRQNVGTVTSLISYSIALILSVVFAFKLNWKAMGLWAGIVIGDGLEACMLITYFLMTMDFTKEAELAIERCQEDLEVSTDIEDGSGSNGIQLKVKSDEKLQNEDESTSLISNTNFTLSKKTIIIRILNFTIPILICFASVFIYLD